MRKSKVLAQWQDNQFARFCGMGHVLPFFIRYAAHYKYDGIWLDLEHRNFDAREVQHLQALCHLYDIDCMIRPPTIQRTRLYRYLEDGAAGLMIPFVSDAEMARQIVAATKFPPLGNRGLDGAGLDCNFGGDHSWGVPAVFLLDEPVLDQAEQDIGKTFHGFYRRRGVVQPGGYGSGGDHGVDGFFQVYVGEPVCLLLCGGQDVVDYLGGEFYLVGDDHFGPVVAVGRETLGCAV